MSRTEIAKLQFYLLETDKAQPPPSCSRNNFFDASSAVLLITSGLSSLVSRLWAQDRGLTIGSIDHGVQSDISARLLRIEFIFFAYLRCTACLETRSSSSCF